MYPGFGDTIRSLGGSSGLENVTPLSPLAVLLTPSTILQAEGGGPGRASLRHFLRLMQGGGTWASHGAVRSRGKEHGDKERAGPLADRYQIVLLGEVLEEESGAPAFTTSVVMRDAAEPSDDSAQSECSCEAPTAGFRQ